MVYLKVFSFSITGRRRKGTHDQAYKNEYPHVHIPTALWGDYTPEKAK
jgi:hypothetical protein